MHLIYPELQEAGRIFTFMFNLAGGLGRIGRCKTAFYQHINGQSTYIRANTLLTLLNSNMRLTSCLIQES